MTRLPIIACVIASAILMATPRLSGVTADCQLPAAAQCNAGVCPCSAQNPSQAPPSDPTIGVVLTGRPGEPSEEGWLTPPDDDGEDLTDPEDVDDIGTTTGGDVADGYQRLTLEFDPIVVPPAPKAAAPARPVAWSILVDFFTALRGPVLEAHAANPLFSALIVSNGASQGQAFKLSIVNHTGKALRIGGEGIVVEPLKAQAMKAAQQQLARFPRGIANVHINGFCLDERLLTPTAGMVFRIAPPRVQQQIGSMRSVLKAARTLRVTDALHPDSSPDSYTDFIKQWSIWTKRERWSEPQFAAKFIEHTRKRFDADKRPWTSQVETALRAASPNRWRDIQSVLSLADGQ